MPRIRIFDLTEGHLAFDLVDLLELLGESVRDSTWRCSVHECIPVEEARPNLEDGYNTSARLSGAELLALAAKTRQVIDGKFEAFRPEERSPWITLEAIDSTYWEVSTSDRRDLSLFEARFQKVEHLN